MLVPVSLSVMRPVTEPVPEPVSVLVHVPMLNPISVSELVDVSLPL